MNSDWILACQGGSNIPSIVAIGDSFAWHNLGMALVVEIGGTILVCSFSAGRNPSVVVIEKGEVFRKWADTPRPHSIVLWGKGNKRIGKKAARDPFIGMGATPKGLALDLLALFDPATNGVLEVLVVDLDPDDLTLRVKSYNASEGILAASRRIREMENV